LARERDNRGITDRKAYLKLTATAAIWGFSWLCGRVISSEGVPAIHASIGRFVFGSLGLLVSMIFYRPWPGFNMPTALRLLAMGFFGVFLYNLCFFTGLRTVPAGRASLMAALQPSVVFLFSAVVWGERATGLKIAGLMVSLFGAFLVLSQAEPKRLLENGVNTGDLWVLGCVVSWVAYTLIGRTLAGRIPVVAATAYSTWIGTALLVAFGKFQSDASPVWSSRVWLATVFLGVFGTAIAFLFYLQGLRQIGASRASIFVNFVPVFGVIFSSLILGESLSGATLAGGACVIVGVRLLNQ
jgi:drug/metabolite transporter (DMT)-like permease